MPREPRKLCNIYSWYETVKSIGIDGYFLKND